MDQLIIRKKNEVFLEIFTDSGIEAELQEFFSFFVPGYQFMPKYKMRMWDGKIRLFNRHTKELYVGLLPKLREFADSRCYDIILEDGVETQKAKIAAKDVYNKLHLPVEPRDYQIDSLQHAIDQERCLLLSPTGSGKSLMIYGLARLYGKKTLIIVPTTSLVLQMYNDFEDYSIKDPNFNRDKMCHCIYSGQEKQTKKPIVISTWQSLQKMPRSYFDQYEVIIGDEVHQFKAKSLVGIMEKTHNAKYRIGTTGTLDNSLTHQLVLEGLFGQVYKATSTKKLMDEKMLAQLQINCIILKYDEQVSKEVKKKKYQEEIKFLIENTKRNLFIRNLACSRKSNTMVLFQFIKHGKELYNMIKDKVEKDNENRKVFFVSGDTDKDVREKVRQITEKEKDAIIVASSGVFSTGINIKSLENIIFASPSKARIRILQSIGRALRIGKSDKAKLYDICDDLTYGSYKNFALKHFLERIKIYNSEKFPYKVVKIDM